MLTNKNSMYKLTLRGFLKYLRANNYTPTTLRGTIFLNEWYITFSNDFEYLTVSHPFIFPISYSFPVCDFDKAMQKLHAFTKTAMKLKSCYPYKPLSYPAFSNN
jgi:hypothetical protein